MKIQFLNSLAYPSFFCGVCFVFKPAIIVYYMWAKDLTGGLSLLMEKLYFILFVILQIYFY